ncbi:MAG: hypothetical protein V2I40_03955 [Desulfobacteraceae bacterium]|nr:hypothetical protein [Desulfobacteraceae bacterium]
MTDGDGLPLPNGTYTMNFFLFDAALGGNQLWNSPCGEQQEVTVAGGIYNVQLGAVQPLDSSVFDGGVAWLEVVIEGEILSPRQRITSTAYALKAEDADTLTGRSLVDLDALYVQEVQAGAVNSTMIADGTVSAADLGSNSVGSSELATGAVGTAEVADNSITAADLAADSVGYSEISANAVREEEIRWSINHTAGDLNGGIMSLTNSSAATSGNFPMGVAGQITGDPIANPVIGVFGGAPGLGQGAPMNSFPDTKIGVGGASDTGHGVVGVSNSGYGVYAYSDTSHGLYARANGTSARAVEGYAANTGSTANYGGRFQADGTSGYGVYGYSPNYIGVYGYGGNYGLYGYATEQYSYGVRGYANGANGYGGYFQASNTYGIGIYAYGGASGYAAEFRGNVLIRDRSSNATVMELGAGLDYAEGFDVSDNAKPDPGSVLIIDPENPGKLTLPTTAYDTKVAGIVAGANGLGSGVRLGVDQFDNDVALAGRVFCKVDATNAAVRTGDLLTTSELPGYAMKASDHVRAHGAILGKAMQDLKKGEKDQILVLVTLQ